MNFTLTYAFIAALLSSTAVRLWLDVRQRRHVASNRHAVPSAFSQTIPLDAHRKAADYTLAKLRLHTVTTIVGAVVLLTGGMVFSISFDLLGVVVGGVAGFHMIRNVLSVWAKLRPRRAR